MDPATGRLMAMKNIAVLVPSYNATSTLEGTLRAMLALGDELERHVDFVMLSDDGSKDDTIGLAERVWNHPGVPLHIRRVARNGGEYRNVNGAFADMPAHIEWVLIMHADNEPLPGWVDLLAREVGRAGPEVASICGSWHAVENGKVLHWGDKRGSDFVEVIEGTPAAVRGTLFNGCWWHNSTAAIRISAWKQIGGHPQETPLQGALELLGVRQPPEVPARKIRLKGDWDSLLRMLSSGFSIRYVGQPLIRYIEVTTSISSGAFAWHGDVVEILQIMRRHQSALSMGDVLKLHGRSLNTLFRRAGGSILRGHWRRLGHAVEAVPVVFASLWVCTLRHLRDTRRETRSIPWNADRNAP